MLNRRSLLTGLSGILAAGFAPAAIGSQVLMPVKSLEEDWVYLGYGATPNFLILSANCPSLARVREEMQDGSDRVILTERIPKGSGIHKLMTDIEAKSNMVWIGNPVVHTANSRYN